MESTKTVDNIEDSERRQSVDLNEVESKQRVELSSDHLNCPICFVLPVGDVFQCSNGHILCETCCNAIQLQRNICPSCSVSLTTKSRNLFARAIIGETATQCPHQLCQEQILMKYLPRHQRACMYGEMECTNASIGCGWKGYRRDVTSHEDSCSLIPARVEEEINRLRKGKKSVETMLNTLLLRQDRSTFMHHKLDFSLYYKLHSQAPHNILICCSVAHYEQRPTWNIDVIAMRAKEIQSSSIEPFKVWTEVELDIVARNADNQLPAVVSLILEGYEDTPSKGLYQLWVGNPELKKTVSVVVEQHPKHMINWRFSGTLCVDVTTEAC
jgi:hypothetical protein